MITLFSTFNAGLPQNGTEDAGFFCFLLSKLSLMTEIHGKIRILK